MPPRVPPVQYCSVEEAARVLRVNVNSLYRAIRAHDFPVLRIGGYYRVPLEALGITPEPVPVFDKNFNVYGQLLLDLRW